jgi:rod shape determining protein RodA
MDLRTLLRRFDFILLAVTLGLMAYGVAMIYLATKDDPLPTPSYWAMRQVIYAAVGLVALIAIALIDYERFRRWQWILYAFTVFSIAAVYLLGPLTRGSRRWIPLGFFDFQPSELAIVLICLSLAAFLVDRLESVGSWRLTLLGLGYAMVPALLVFAQPDLGTATVIAVMGLGLLFFFGTKWQHFLAIGTAAVAGVAVILKVLPLMGLQLVHDYQLARLTVFLDKSADPTAAGYNVRQAMIAVGSGGMTGRGSLATQTQLAFLPEHHTDFIFAVVGERWGFLGAIALLVLYGLFLWRALRIAAIARDMYGSVMAGGIAVVILYQLLVNMGMSLGIMPVTGIPLPFISYGGAALITNLLLVGLLESIHFRGSEALAQRGTLPMAAGR